uniref:RRM domain-containing protein n=1 Tax=Picea sitchensis TaxID=3332 RepID=A9NYV1_PICSI|nr:unknown [Picea sitchensis]
MAFAAKLGSLLKQSVTKHVSSRPSVYMPAIYSAFRCMSSKVFVGGLSYGVDDQTLRESFATFGDVMEAKIINDRETGRSRGFGFVTFASPDEANAASRPWMERTFKAVPFVLTLHKSEPLVAAALAVAAAEVTVAVAAAEVTVAVAAAEVTVAVAAAGDFGAGRGN